MLPSLTVLEAEGIPTDDSNSSCCVLSSYCMSDVLRQFLIPTKLKRGTITVIRPLHSGARGPWGGSEWSKVLPCIQAQLCYYQLWDIHLVSQVLHGSASLLVRQEAPNSSSCIGWQ